jgi:predicted O-methyltransferase YrrM
MDKKIKGKRYRQIIQQKAISLAADGDWAEFGVASGTSANRFLRRLPETSKFYLFDSFEGLPEDWFGRRMVKGKFACEPPKFDDDRVVVVKGFFEDTLQEWSNSYTGKLGLVHIDCDLYSSTLCVLRNIRKHLVVGSVLLFDEFDLKKAKPENREDRAYYEFLKETNMQFEERYHTIGCQKLVTVKEGECGHGQTK